MRIPSIRLPLTLPSVFCYAVASSLVLWVFGKEIPGIGLNLFMLGTLPLYFFSSALLVKKTITLRHKYLFVIFILMHIIYYSPQSHTNFVIHACFQMVACLVFYIIMANLVEDPEVYSKMILFVILSTTAVLVCLLYLHLFVFRSVFLTTHITSQEMHYLARGGKNTLAFFIVLVFPFVFARFSYHKNLLNLLLLLIFAGSAIYTQSRMALLSLGFTTFAFCFVAIRKGIFIRQGVVVILCLLLLKLTAGIGLKTFMVWREGKVSHSIASGKKTFIPRSGGHRGGLLKIGWDGFLHNPVFGKGVASFRGRTSFGSVTHNDYVQILYEFGTFGIVLFTGIFALFFFEMRKVRHYVPPTYHWVWDGQVVALLNLAFLLMGINAYDTIPFWFIWAGCAILLRLFQSPRPLGQAA